MRDSTLRTVVEWTYGVVVVLILVGLLVLALTSCAGPRTVAAEAELDRVQRELEQSRSDLAEARAEGQATDELESRVDALSRELAEALRDLGRAQAEDTKDTLLGLPTEVANLLLLGAGGLALNARRNATRRKDLESLHQRIDRQQEET